ncbi:MAG: copper amine oxidase N-terminal domain-containing protein [Coprothermobacterota bacterium]|nr:copper amine oxidase N-terminal domain-containing protein [Coprothermobacterota bacterium]
MRWCVVFVLLLALVFPCLGGIPSTVAAQPEVVVYDFIANAANAEWVGWEGGSNHPLTYGSSSFTDGFAMAYSGSVESGESVSNGLETYPPSNAPSGTTGDFRHVFVPKNAQLKVTFGFKSGANATDGVEVGVAFALDDPSTPVSQLINKTKGYDGSLLTATFDLSPYGERIGGFQLFVRSGPSATADALVWTAAVITVTSPSPGQPSVVTYDFMAAAYAAEWFGWVSGASQPITFNAAATNQGYAGGFDGALEDGKNYTNALQTIPPLQSSSGLTAECRNLYIPAGSRLRFLFGFQKGLNATDGVEAGIGAYAASSIDVELAVEKKYDNSLKEGILDLSSYADVIAGFQLFVRAGASAQADGLVWVRAVIEIPAPVISVVPTVMHFFIGNPVYQVNSLSKTMDTSPVIVESRTFLPIRFVVEELGAVVAWNQSEQKVTITLHGKTLELWIGRNYATVDGKNELIDPANPNVAPFLQPPGRTMMPLRFISETLGCKVDWLQPTQEVVITYPAP